MPKNKNTLLLALPRNEKSTAMPPLWASQNFLTSRAIIHSLIQRTNLTKNDHVIEIGPGKGHITRALLERCCHVTAVELDRALYLRLTEQFKGAANLTLRNADFAVFSTGKGALQGVCQYPLQPDNGYHPPPHRMPHPSHGRISDPGKRGGQALYGTAAGNAAFIEPEALF